MADKNELQVIVKAGMLIFQRRLKDGLKSWDCNLKKGDRNSGQSDDASVPFEE